MGAPPPDEAADVAFLRAFAPASGLLAPSARTRAPAAAKAAFAKEEAAKGEGNDRFAKRPGPASHDVCRSVRVGERVSDDADLEAKRIARVSCGVPEDCANQTLETRPRDPIFLHKPRHAT